MNKEFRAVSKDLGATFDVTEKSDFTLEFGNEKPILHMHCSDGVFDSFEVEVVQFTGLFDKHEAKIFEGDVIQSGRTKLNYVVEWDDEEAGFTAFCTHPDKDFFLGRYSWEDSKIIDDPELLEETK